MAPSDRVEALMLPTDQVPPLTVVVAALVVWLPSVMVTEMVSPLSPVPAAETLATLAMLMLGVLVNATFGPLSVNPSTSRRVSSTPRLGIAPGVWKASWTSGPGGVGAPLGKLYQSPTSRVAF